MHTNIAKWLCLTALIAGNLSATAVPRNIVLILSDDHR